MDTRRSTKFNDHWGAQPFAWVVHGRNEYAPLPRGARLPLSVLLQKMSVDIDATPDLLKLIRQKLRIVLYGTDTAVFPTRGLISTVT